MQITSSHSSVLSRLDPNRWVKKGSDELTLKGAVAATGLAVASKVREAFYYTGLAVEAMSSESPLPWGDQIHRLDVMRRGVKAFNRVTTTENLPLGDASPLKDLPGAVLKRPIMLVPGWDTSHDRFRPLTDKLTDGGANGGKTYYLRAGEFFHDQNCLDPLPLQEVPGDARVFVTVFNNTSEAPPATAPQLEANLEALRRVVGGPAPDVIAYSQGGLATRTYLDGGGSDVGRLVFVGTPNSGAGLASLSNFAYKAQDKGYDVDFLLSDLGLDPEDRASIEFMTVGSEPLEKLNGGWDAQMARTEGFQIVGYQGAQTFHYGLPPFGPGDGLVAAAHLGPEGVERTYVQGEWTKHKYLPISAGAYQEMHRYLDWS